MSKTVFEVQWLQRSVSGIMYWEVTPKKQRFKE